MRKTEKALLDLIAVFASRTIRENERDHRREQQETARRHAARKRRP